uniref:N-acetylglucosamine-6-phosphate deacetylase n=1 Tax=Lepisosteus oculatus TaxID=7918 RepID=W5MRE7_LEPOC
MPSNKSVSDAPITQFVNCRILKDHQLQREDLWVREGKILNPEKLFFDEEGSADAQVDCHDSIIAPGFIDVQINGEAEPCSGTLHSVIPLFTLIANPSGPHFKDCSDEILCIVLWGGSESIRNWGVSLQQPDVGGFGGDRRPTSLALVGESPAENPPGAIVQRLNSPGSPLRGHSVANLSQAEEAVREGATFITHLFNAMLPFHHRDPGIVGLLTSDRVPTGRTVFYGMIADGIHTNPAALRIAHRAHPAGLVLVTDAITAMGLPPGRHTLGQQVIEIEGLNAYVAGTKTLSGSIATMDMCVRHFLQASGCTVEAALEAASLHPAQLLGISQQKGTLDYGADADFVLLDDSLDVKATYIAGEQVWEK